MNGKLKESTNTLNSKQLVREGQEIKRKRFRPFKEKENIENLFEYSSLNDES